VYLALNATTGDMLACKQVVIPSTTSDKDDERQLSVVAALKSEIETLKDLDHPRIVQYLGACLKLRCESRPETERFVQASKKHLSI
jgi:hypothetical protein